MNLLKSAIAASACVLASSVGLAGAFEGSFAGQASYTNTNSVAEICQLSVSVSRTETALTVALSADSEHTGFSQQTTFDINGTEVSYNGVVVGTATDALIDVKNVDLSGDVYGATITVNADGSGITYSDSFCYASSGMCEYISGSLALSADSGSSTRFATQRRH